MSAPFVPSNLPRRIETTSGRSAVLHWRVNADGWYFCDLNAKTARMVRITVNFRTEVTEVADVDRLGRTGRAERYEDLELALRFYGWHIP